MSKQRLHGFSLIELLVVMLLVSIFAVGVSLAVNPAGSTEKQLNAAGEKLFAQMLFAQDDALVRDQASGIVFNLSNSKIDFDNDYQWQRYSFSSEALDNKKNFREWIKTNKPLGAHTIDKKFTWSVEVEDISIEENLDRLLNETEVPEPSVVFYPSGEISEFVIILSWTDELLKKSADLASQRYKITIDEAGELSRYRVGELDE
jgi:type II secretion system protein H